MLMLPLKAKHLIFLRKIKSSSLKSFYRKLETGKTGDREGGDAPFLSHLLTARDMIPTCLLPFVLSSLEHLIYYLQVACVQLLTMECVEFPPDILKGALFGSYRETQVYSTVAAAFVQL